MCRTGMRQHILCAALEVLQLALGLKFVLVLHRAHKLKLHSHAHLLLLKFSVDLLLLTVHAMVQRLLGYISTLL